MSNEFYSHTGWPATSGSGQSVDARAELAALEAAFDKLPALTSNANKIVIVNSSANGLTISPTSAPIAATTWTPTLTAATPGDLSVTYSTQTGWCYRFGGVSYVGFEIVTSAFTHTTASGNLLVTGLSSSYVGSYNAYGSLNYSGMTKAGYHHMTLYLGAGTVQFSARVAGSAVAAATAAITDFPTAGSVILRGQIMIIGTT